MHANAADWSAIQDWDDILHPEDANTRFDMGYRSNPKYCTDGGSDTCQCFVEISPIITTPAATTTTVNTLPIIPGVIGSAAIIAAVATAAYMRSNAAMMSHLQVYQKEVFYEALNRNRATDVRLLDVTDNPSYTVDPDNLGV